MLPTGLLAQKIYEVRKEMESSGLWKKLPPEWVSHYEKRNIATEHEFSEWLQFVYLPNLLQCEELKNVVIPKNLIVPQAVKFFAKDVKKGKLLQLLIELDSLP